MNFLKGLFFIMIVLLAGCAARKAPAPIDYGWPLSNPVTPPIPAVPIQATTYTVAPGDNLYFIASQHNLDFQYLAQLNHIQPPYTVTVGQKLRLAGKLQSKPTKSAKKSTAKPPTMVFHPAAPAPKASTAAPTSKVSESKVSAPRVSKAAVKPVPPVHTVASSATRTVGGVNWRWPASGLVVLGYSPGATGNNGLNIVGPEGQPIYAAAAGKVVYSANGLQSYGKMIILKHKNGYLTAYAHNQKLLVHSGDWVKSGQEIALMGKTGASRTMLHFEIRKNGNPKDPINYLPPRKA